MSERVDRLRELFMIEYRRAAMAGTQPHTIAISEADLKCLEDEYGLYALRDGQDGPPEGKGSLYGVPFQVVLSFNRAL